MLFKGANKETLEPNESVDDVASGVLQYTTCTVQSSYHVLSCSSRTEKCEESNPITGLFVIDQLASGPGEERGAQSLPRPYSRPSSWLTCGISVRRLALQCCMS
jgi:hypothetical protein